MPKKDKRLLGKVELMIMDVIWEQGEATVRQVRDTMAPRHDLAYTTVLTMMKQLEQKGVLTHRMEERTYIYRALISRDEVERSMVRELLHTVFGGSYEQLVNVLVKHERVSREALIRIAHRIDEEEVSG